MSRLKKHIPVFVIALAMMLSTQGCGTMQEAGPPLGSWRYRTTVVVETPEGIKTGTAVREVIIPDRVSKARYPRIRGEAVVVDLGKRGVLFALIGQGYDSDHIFEVFPMNPAHSGGLSDEGIKYYSSPKNAKATLTPQQYPMFVRFKDPKDPKSVDTAIRDVVKCPDDRKECIGRTGYLALNTMNKSFGNGVAIKEVTIEMTEDSVTHEVSKFLPSFDEETGFMMWVRSLPYGDSRRFGPDAFRKGDNNERYTP